MEKNNNLKPNVWVLFTCIEKISEIMQFEMKSKERELIIVNRIHICNKKKKQTKILVWECSTTN